MIDTEPAQVQTGYPAVLLPLPQVLLPPNGRGGVQGQGSHGRGPGEGHKRGPESGEDWREYLPFTTGGVQLGRN